MQAPQAVRSRRPANDDTSRRPPRIALYGHDTLGLGHLRRNLALAASFAGLDLKPDILVLSGAPEASSFPLPDGVELITVPSIRKDGAGVYDSHRLSVGLENILAMRRGILRVALEEFAPDLLVVDKVPLGLHGELEMALRTLRAAGRTRIVLGLRDVLDEPAVASAEWRTGRMTQAVRDFYDEIWVYGDPSVHDVIAACEVPPSLRGLVRYTGYLANGRAGAVSRPPMLAADRPYVLGTVGGGQDGVALATAFAQAPMPDGVTGLLLTGPQMSAGDRAGLDRLAAGREDLIVHTFTPDVSSWVASAAGVVTMGGANTVAEILATDVPALIVPREQPRAEQVVRAQSLAVNGLVDWLPQDEADGDAIGSWLARRCGAGQAGVDRTSIALDGLAVVRELATALLETAVAPTEVTTSALVPAVDGFDDEGAYGVAV